MLDIHFNNDYTRLKRISQLQSTTVNRTSLRLCLSLHALRHTEFPARRRWILQISPHPCGFLVILGFIRLHTDWPPVPLQPVLLQPYEIHR